MIKEYRDGKLWEMQSLREAAGLDQVPAPVVAAIGGGGKTTTLGRLAQEYGATGEKAIVLTTTHMREETTPWSCVAEEEQWNKDTGLLDQVWKLLEQYGQAVIGTKAKMGKMSCVPEKILRVIMGWKIPLLVEADGAKCLPLKVPAAHEPVIPPQTTHVFSVYGLDALDQKLEDICFRSELATELLGKKGTDPVTEEELVRLACHEQGGRKGCPEKAEYIVVLNKADTEALEKRAAKIAEKLQENGIQKVLVTSYRE